MKIIIITGLLIVLFLTGCTFVDDVMNLKFKPRPEVIPPITPPNQTTNTTNTTTIIETTLDSSLDNVFVFSNSILVVDDEKSYVIDIPKEYPAVVSYLQMFNINELEFVVSTIDKEEHNGGIQYIVSISPPKAVWDNGIENINRDEYIYKFSIYNKYWNKTPITNEPFLIDISLGKFDFFVPYSRGLSTVKEENSVVTLYNKKLLYMSDCYGDCENKIPPILTKYIVLANNGKCPTNSFEFIVGTGARYVIADEICSTPEEGKETTLKEELDMIGIKQIIGKPMVHLILEEDGDEVYG